MTKHQTGAKQNPAKIKYELTDEAKRILKSRLRLEYEFYDYANQRLDQQLRQHTEKRTD